VNRKRTLELVAFLEDMYDYNLKSLKEYVESKEKNRKLATNDNNAMLNRVPKISVIQNEQ
jgi:hypothetical protein